MIYKQCKKCKGVFPATNEHFHKHRTNKDGLTGKCKNCIADDKREYKKKHKGKVALAKKLYVMNNKDRKKAWDKKYRETHKEILRIKHIKYYATKRAKILNLINWHKKNARKELQNYNFSIYDWEECLEYFNNSCAYCGIQDVKLQQEHFIPKSKSGNYVKSNIIPACSKCNASKKDKDFCNWYSKQSFYSAQREQKILKYINENLEKEKILYERI